MGHAEVKLFTTGSKTAQFSPFFELNKSRTLEELALVNPYKLGKKSLSAALTDAGLVPNVFDLNLIQLTYSG